MDNHQNTMAETENNNDLQQIFESAQTSEKSLFQLLQIGRRQGFDNFINRKQIWPFLLGLDLKKLKDTPVFEWKGGLNRNSFDFEQLQKDAERSLSSMKTFQSITKFHLKKKQEAVLAVLDSFFAKNPELKYIQGFHDVASIFLILFGNSTGYYLMEQAGRTYFYDFLTFEFGQIVYEMVTSEDPEFKTIYSSYQHTKFLIFILPWILTWFSHNFSSVKTICRIWDYLLSTGPHGIFYLTSGIILSTKEQLVANCEEFDEPSVQTFYQDQAKKSQINIQLAIKVALDLQEKIVITQLQGYKTLNEKSMIRAENFQTKISLHRKFHQSRKQNSKLHKNIKTVVKVGTAVVLILATFYLLKNHSKFKQIGQF